MGKAGEGVSPIDILLDCVDWEPLFQDVPDDEKSDGLPWMTHKGVLRIGDIELQCAILSDGRRIFYGEAIEEMMGGLGGSR